jgi:hypothetical protein
MPRNEIATGIGCFLDYILYDLLDATRLKGER